MQGIGKVKFKRAVVPEYAVNLNINITDAADASKKLACTVKLKMGISLNF